MTFNADIFFSLFTSVFVVLIYLELRRARK